MIENHSHELWQNASIPGHGGPVDLNRSAQRIAVRHGWAGPGRHELARQLAEDMPSMVRTAHDSGDSETVFHCFGGETRYITRDGVKTLAETVGTTQWVLTGTMDDPHGGFWLQAPVVELGEQELWEVTLKRNRRTKVIRATAGHRWLVRRPDRVVTTEHLRTGHRLAHLRARQFDLAPDHEGIRMGFVFGDGTIQQRNAGTYGAVTLWGPKRQLAKYFDEIATRAYETRTEKGAEGLRYTSGMKGYTKALPSLHEEPEYLLGWLMGLFAADGSVTKAGQMSLSSASLETLERVRDIATVLGIGTYEPHSQARKGYGETESLIHTMDFMAEDLKPEFLLRDDQRARVKLDGKPARIGWTVESVRPTGKVEPVYCVRAHGTDSFTLEDNLHCGQCPFCGSGQVIARNDGTIECEFCFSGETEFLTWDGVRTFKETVGTIQKVLVAERFSAQVAKGRSRRGNPKLSDEDVVVIRNLYAEGLTKAELARQFGVVQGTVKKIVERQSYQHLGGGGHAPGDRVTQEAKWGDGHAPFGGIWVDAEIRPFGVQRLYKVTLVRQGVEKVIHATAEHRWFVHPKSGSWHRPDYKVIAITTELQAGDRLPGLFPRVRLRQNKLTTPSPFGAAHGFTFGDGNLTGRGGSQVVLWGEKDQSLLPYFAASRTRQLTNKNGTPGIEIKDLPAFFKEFPSRGESLSYRYGWLAGYFAADGSVSKTGTPTLSCANREVLEWVRDFATQIGIGTYGISANSRIGFEGRVEEPLYSLAFVASTLTPDFFVHPEHRRRFEARKGVQETYGWTVASVEKTGREEEVYCAVVPGHENFTLAGNINVMNCQACFTVQVQPQYPAFPQTINGMPVNVPGMGPQWPGQDPNGADAGQDAGQVGGQMPPGVEDAPPTGGDGPEQPGGDENGATDQSDDDNPFAKKSTLYRTAQGQWLTEAQYLKHIAFATTSDRAALAAKIMTKTKATTGGHPSGNGPKPVHGPRTPSGGSSANGRK